MSCALKPISNKDNKHILGINNQAIQNPDGSYTASSSWVASGIKWSGGSYGTPGGNVTWSFAEFNYPERLSFSQQLYNSLKDDVRNAFNNWESIANITFTETTDSANTDIRVGMNNIDGFNNTLGSAHYTYTSNSFNYADIQLDTSENWSGSLPFLTLLHEIGHAIGLGHEDSVPAIMNSTIDTNLTNLTSDDKAGVIKIYGSAVSTAPTDIPASIDTTAIADIGKDYLGVIDSVIDTDWIKVELFAGTDYTIKLKGVETKSGTLDDPFIAGIYNTLGTSLGSSTSNDDGGIGLNALVNFTATQTANFFVAAQTYSTTAKDGDSYALSIEYAAPNTNFKATDSKNLFQGNQGIDSVQYSMLYSQVTISTSNQSDTFFIDHNGVRDQLTNIERVQFLDKNIALDIDDNAGKAYRLYKAALDREPDTAGLGYWINDLDNGNSLVNISQGFINNTEFQKLYGIGLSKEQLITLLYENVLNRSPDQAGFDYWINDLNTGTSYAGALASFSESTENKANVIGQIEKGISYDVWVS